MSQTPEADHAPKYFPITLRLDDARILVIGGGEIYAAAMAVADRLEITAVALEWRLMRRTAVPR